MQGPRHTDSKASGSGIVLVSEFVWGPPAQGREITVEVVCLELRPEEQLVQLVILSRCELKINLLAIRGCQGLAEAVLFELV